MYVIDFCVISLIYLSITAIFYFTQNRVSNNRNKFFGFLLILGLCSLVLDILAAVIDKKEIIPIWIEYAVNILFLACAQLNGPVFLEYTLVIIGIYPKTKKLYRILMFIPFIIVMILLLSSPFTHDAIFYIKNGNSYEAGTLHMVLYIVVFIYLFASFIISLIKFRKVQRVKIFSICVFLCITFFAMIIQLLTQKILVNSMGNALALTIIYHTLQTADDHTDSLTRLLSGKSLNDIINDLYEQNQKFSLFIYTLREFRVINQEYGVKSGDELMIAFASYLRKKFEKSYIVRIIGDVYGVIDISTMGQADYKLLNKMSIEVPTKWKIGDNTIQMESNIIGINSGDFDNANQLLSFIHYIELKHELGDEKVVLLVDEKYRKGREYYTKVEQILANVIKERKIDVYYQPIHDKSGKLVAFEALSRIIDKDLGFISPDLFITIAEQNGLILQLGEIVLENVCRFIENNSVCDWNLHHIGVNLSFIQCTNKNIYTTLKSIIKKYNIPKNLISFEITETATDATLNIVKQNMNLFINDGYAFMLDDFGSGYANYNYVLGLPFKCIKIDKYILWKAMNSNKDMIYLKTLVKVLNKLNFLTICEGVETKEQSDILNQIGVTMQQGYYYSKAMDEKATIAYVEKSKTNKK